jgi:hypothetical protein
VYERISVYANYKLEREVKTELREEVHEGVPHWTVVPFKKKRREEEEEEEEEEKEDEEEEEEGEEDL